MHAIAQHLAIARVARFWFYKKQICFNRFFLLFIGILVYWQGQSQMVGANSLSTRNRRIEPDVRGNWELLREGGWSISPDGKYAAWVVDNPKNGPTLVISAIDGSWKRELRDQGLGFFAVSGRRYISSMFGKWCIVPLGAGEPQYLEELDQ
ncbi:MAG: hypothetical protein J7497_12080, partial [Chitinophagaceae bacterium]|nr:hypothetical protein [Chitinophagaceae bacterium]